MSIQDQIRAYVRQTFYVTGELGDGDSLLDTGTIDSTGVLELIAFVEQRFPLKVGDREIVPENFDSIERVATFVERKLREAAPAEARATAQDPTAASIARRS